MTLTICLRGVCYKKQMQVGVARGMCLILLNLKAPATRGLDVLLSASNGKQVLFGLLDISDAGSIDLLADLLWVAALLSNCTSIDTTGCCE